MRTNLKSDTFKVIVMTSAKLSSQASPLLLFVDAVETATVVTLMSVVVLAVVVECDNVRVEVDGSLVVELDRYPKHCFRTRSPQPAISTNKAALQLADVFAKSNSRLTSLIGVELVNSTQPPASS
jgi:hypothetical protein